MLVAGGVAIRLHVEHRSVLPPEGVRPAASPAHKTWHRNGGNTVTMRWYLSQWDNQVHAFPDGQPASDYLEAVCEHSAPQCPDRPDP